MKKNRLLALTLALLLFLPLAFTLAEENEPEKTGHFFADMALTTLDGQPFDTSIFIGKPLLLNIWATWCGPCVGELPHLNELAEEYKDKLVIVGLHSEGLSLTQEGELEPNEETNQLAIAMQQDKGLSYPLLNPDKTLWLLMSSPQYGLQVQYLPTTWLIDGQGYIRQVISSAYDKAGWTQIIEEFLSKLQAEAEKPAE